MMRPIRNIGRLSYRLKIMLTASSITLAISVLLSLFSWHLSVRIFEQQEVKLLQRSALGICDQINTTLDMVQSLTVPLIQDDAISRISRLQAPTMEATAEDTAYLSKIVDRILSGSAASTSASIQFISIFLKNGYELSTIPSSYTPFRSYDNCLSAMKACGISDLNGYIPTCWVDSITLQGGNRSNYLVGMRFLYENITLEKIGVVVIGIQPTTLQQIFNNSLISSASLIRSDGKILISSWSAEVGRFLDAPPTLAAEFSSVSSSTIIPSADGGSSFLFRLSGRTAYLLCPIEENLLNKGPFLDKYAIYVIVITLGAFVLSLLLAWFSSKGLTRSLIRLKATVQKVYDGDLKARFQPREQDEIAYLGLKINDMLEQVETSLLLQEQDAAEKRDLELRLMRAQINPHLLYNTLNSILWIIRQKDMEKAEHLILSLGNFFKLALSKGDDEIPLSNEIAMIQRYLDIQNLGRGKHLVLCDEVNEPWRSCSLLRLTLQTLVENSVIHGFSDWRDDGIITISARAADTHTLLITVTDNGIGILPEDITSLTAQINSSVSAEHRNHYGLWNVNRRIKNKYGPQYGLSIESEVGCYTSITITTPIKKEGNHD